eukprot:CAMPEP_0118947066 /NCGR_PEP_ID=MMETSP1169-20130426/45310_1 /TAXON_ID=36882 /ORGANISM="Pyramimonas obovata, Strain CCMP722" /LENGTH=467 /DNA_ID=CAMNT_0006893201 /DNA_START=319 /DNA_END=1719 /DNA_ORIENTATION=+
MATGFSATSMSRTGKSSMRALPVLPPPPTLRVFPPSIHFDMDETGELYGETITIKNCDNRPHLVRTKQPENKAQWSIDPPFTSVMLAPGMETTVQVYFCTDELKDFADTLLVMTHDQVVEVPLLARGPCANIEFVGDFDFGLVVNESIITRQIILRNKGNKATTWRVKHEKSSLFKLDPLEGAIEANSEGHLDITLKPSELGPVTSAVTFQFDDDVATRRLDVSASVVAQALELLKVDEGEGGPLRKLLFGSVYFGEANVMYADVYNDGPMPTDFTIKMQARKDAEVQALNEEDMDEEEEEKKKATDRPEGYQEEGAEWSEPKPDSSVTCEPMEGFLGPYEKVRLAFTYAPDLREDLRGFKVTRPPVAAYAVDSTFLCQVIFGAFPKRLKMPVIGRGVLPCLKVNPDKVRFSEVPLHGAGDAVVTLENESEEMPVVFNISRATFFTAKPSRGLIQPGCSASTVVTYS